jgi:hypothetical protein
LVSPTLPTLKVEQGLMADSFDYPIEPMRKSLFEEHCAEHEKVEKCHIGETCTQQ